MAQELLDPKEKLLLEFIITDKNIFSKVTTILKSEYFCDGLSRAVSFIQDYFQKYKNVPSVSVIHAETGIELSERTVETHECDYVIAEIENHCRKEAMRLAILKGAEMVNEAMDSKQEYDFGAVQKAVKEALMVSIDKDLGISQLDDDVALRHMAMQQNIDSRPIGWKPLDDMLDNVRRGEMVIFAGSTGTGKSVVLANVATMMASQGLNVLLLSLELKQELISMRLDSILTGYPTKKIYDYTDKISQKFTQFKTTYGSIHVKKMKYRDNANKIRAYLLEYNLVFGHFPDVIIVDHMDRMAPINTKKNTSNKFDIDEDIAEELRDVFDEFDAYGFTASQLNRDSVDATVKSQNHIAGGLSKINTADAVIAIIRSQERINNGEIEFQPLKLRNAEMNTTPAILHWNDFNLQITENPSVVAPAKNTTSYTSGGMSNRVKDMLSKNKQ